MKLRFLFVFLLGSASLLRAITPAPYTVGVDFSLRISGGLSGGNGEVYVYDETGLIPGATITNSGTSPVESGLNVAWLRPGREYVVFVVSNGNPQEYWASFRPPDGYRLRISKQDTSILYDTIGATGSIYAEDFRLELLPSGQGVGGMMGEFKGIEFGKSVTWEVGLGGLRTGRSAGGIVYREPDLSSSPAHRSKLHYSSPPHDDQAYAIMNGPSNQYLSQVEVPQGVVDIVDLNSGSLADGFEMRFYAYASVTFNYWTNRWDINGGASPWKTIRVEPNGSNTIKITETEGSSVRRHDATAAAPSSGAYSWTAQVGDNSGTNWLRTVTHTSVVSSPYRDVTEEILTGGTGGTVVSRTKYRYESFAWGEEVTQVIGDPTGAAPTTTYTYHTNSSLHGNYRKVRSVTSPGGGWSASEFYDTWEFRGYPKYEYAPFLDSPGTVTLDPTQGRVVYREYTRDWAGTLVFPTLVETKVNNTVMAKTTYSDGSSWPLRLTTVTTYTASASTLVGYEETHRADSYPDQAGSLNYLRQPDGLEIAVVRDRGFWTPGNWPSSATFSPAWNGDVFREIKVTGTTSSSGATQRSSFDGQSHKAIYLVPYKSTVEATYRNASGGVVRTETYVYTGGSAYERLGIATATYDQAGRLEDTVAANGATTENNYANGRLQDSTDAAGVVTGFTYDAIGRVATVRKVGVASSGSYAAQGDIVTTNTYDGANRITQASTAGGSLTLVNAQAFDKAGRLVSTTAPGGYVTGYGYTNGGRTVTTTYPGGATSISDAYLDGGPKTLTGTGVVHKSWSRWMSSAYLVAAQEYTGSGYVLTRHDGAGRLEIKQHPGGDGTDYYEQYAYYSNGLLALVTHSDGSADRRFEYDTFGRLIREGLDIGANGALDVASNDRISETTAEYMNGGSGNWWLQTTRKTWATASSGTATTLSTQYDRVANFTGTKRAETHHYDINGNFSAVIVNMDPSTKISTKETIVVGSGTSAMETSRNGLMMTSRNQFNQTTTYGYDDLGRRNATADPRIGSDRAVYKTGSSEVEKYYDPAALSRLMGSPSVDKPTRVFAYNSAGLVESVQTWSGDLSVAKYARSTYTARGELYRQWGDTTYPVEYTYDSDGRRTLMKTFRGGTGWTGSSWPGSPGTADLTKWVYDNATGNLLHKYDAANLDGSANPISGAKKVSYTYNRINQLKTRTWARGVVTTYNYSASTRELSSVDYSDSTTDLGYTYNRLGQAATVTDETGTRTFTYNLGGNLQLQTEQLDSFLGSRRVDYGYETSGAAKGRLNQRGVGTSSAFNEYNQSYAYDSVGRLQTTLDFTYAYTSGSNLVAGITHSGVAWNQSRSYLTSADVLDVIETKWSTTSVAKFDHLHDNLYRVDKVAKTGTLFSRYGNGTEGLTTYFGYDDRSQLASEVTKIGTGSTVLTGRNDSAYAWDNLGNRNTVTHNGNTSTYTTDARNQYTQRTVPGIFDVAGAAGSSTTVTVNGSNSGVSRHGEYFFKAHALTNTWNPAYTTLAVSDGTTTTNVPAFVESATSPMYYDDDGNMTYDGHWGYAYDAENRPSWMQTGDAAIAAGKLKQGLEIRYDYLGRRVKKKRYDWNSGISNWDQIYDDRFLYDGWHILFEFDALASMAKVRAHAWGLDLSGSLQGAGGVGGLLYSYDYANAVTLLPMYDGVGNILGMLTGSGSIGAAYEYDAFGNTLRESGPYAASNPFRFATKYTDIETGLVQHNTRYYSPSLGRFINRDSIGEAGGLNLYAYVSNQVPNAYDYLGMDMTGVDLGDIKNQPPPPPPPNPSSRPNSDGTYTFTDVWEQGGRVLGTNTYTDGPLFDLHLFGLPGFTTVWANGGGGSGEPATFDAVVPYTGGGIHSPGGQTQPVPTTREGPTLTSSTSADGSAPVGTALGIVYANRPAPGGVQDHSYLVITPTDQARWGNQGLFKNIDSKGNYFAVVSAGPEHPYRSLVGLGGQLMPSPNRDTDIRAARNNTMQLEIPSIYRNENAAIQAILNASSNYGANTVPYAAMANGFGGKPHYNSNSFVSGLLDALGFAYGNPQGNPVGFDQPVPMHHFLPPKD